MRRGGFCALVALVALVSCGDAGGGFQFTVVLENRSTEGVEVLVDGRAIGSASTVQLDPRSFDSYAEALEIPVRIETRRDQAMVASCDLYPGACRGACIPERETASICIDPDGTIGLNTWDCPCDDEVDDWFCGGDCALTAP